jgi:hypothetical protein
VSENVMNKLIVTCATGVFALALLGTGAPARSEDHGRLSRPIVNDTMWHLAGSVPSDVEQQWRRRYGSNPPSDLEQRWRRQHGRRLPSDIEQRLGRRGYRNVPSDVEQRWRPRSGGVPSDLEQAWRRYGDGGPIPSEFEQQWRRGRFD